MYQCKECLLMDPFTSMCPKCHKPMSEMLGPPFVSDSGMRLQKQPSRWTCIPTAFAMVLRISVADVLAEIGHDGSTIVEPQLEEPMKRRAFHIQELIDVCHEHGRFVMPIEPQPTLKADPLYIVDFSMGTQKRIEDYLRQYEGVLIGTTARGWNHAVAWDRRLVYDPNGIVYDPAKQNPKFSVSCFWIVHAIKSQEGV